MATFWEIAARSVSNFFYLYFVYLLYLFISRFGFKSGICLLIAPVPVHCFSITFSSLVNSMSASYANGQKIYVYILSWSLFPFPVIQEEQDVSYC